jgi:hypothetical protein
MDILNEIWVDILNYEGIYQISNLGKVKSLNYRNTKKEKILNLSKSTRGYPQVQLNKNGFGKTFSIHQLVAIAFLGHKPDGTQKIVVDHINNDKTDNRVVNLQLINSRENNTKDQKPGISKYVGVTFNKVVNKWHSRITIKNKTKHLGYFDSELEAFEAYQKALLEID